MRCIGQGLESLKTLCCNESSPNPVEQKSYDVINNKLSRVTKEVAEESMKRAAVEENSSSPDNPFNGDGDTKTFDALSENKPYGDDYLIQKIECVGHVQKENGVCAYNSRSRFHNSWLSARSTLLGLPLTQNHRRLRRPWCDERGCQWLNGMFLSLLTVTFCLQPHGGRIRVWRHRGFQHAEHCVMPCHTGPAPGNMVRVVLDITLALF
ncbi:transposable element Tcb1 transposase [Trichonephila clavipes]|nr:transposable element Tcb1 transposase [Trichonephila clavipes]